MQILWFRQDLRLSDQRALLAAVAAGPVLPVYILDDETPGLRPMGAASRWWLHHSLAALDASLRKRGNRLLLLRGPSAATLRALAASTGATRIHATTHYEPWWKAAQADLADLLTLHPGHTLADPASVTSGSGGRYRIFTPFWRALLNQMPPPDPLPAPQHIPATDGPDGDTLADWALLPTDPGWSTGFTAWQPGEKGAHRALKAWLPQVAGYETTRNLPSEAGTSRLSPHLHFGELSPATVWHAALDAAGKAAASFTRQLVWRDFGQGMIDTLPDSHWVPHRDAFARFPFRDAPADLRAWQRGRTGYPLVDAGMRQLWQSGWMHNRVRMVAASFLTKHLLIDWRRGEEWFWDTLLDADLGNNAMGWQWVMGSGVDSSPYNRIFAPVGQSEKFDAAGYIRRWVPELAPLSDTDIHAPWRAARPTAAYPAPIVDHAQARTRALSAYESIR